MKRSTLALTAGVAVLVSLLITSIASAHAPIAFITWDADTSPTTLTASTDERAMETAPGSFYLRVYNVSGSRVDNGDAAVSDDTYSITVTLQSGLTAGTYRVDWLTTSTDGKVLSGSESVPLPGGIAPPEEEEAEEHEHEAGEEHEEAEEQAPDTAAPISPPSTGDAGLVSQPASGLNTLAAIAAVATVIAATGGLAYAARRQS